MTEQELLAFCKAQMRLSTTSFDNTEIIHLIRAAKQDIKKSIQDININDERYPLLVSAFVRSNFGKGSEEAQKTYESLLRKVAYGC